MLGVQDNYWYNLCMGKTLTEADLNNIPKETLVVMYLELKEQMDQLQVKMDSLQENMNVLIQQRFGRKTEQTSQITGQLAINNLGEIVEILNEAEQLTEDGLSEEPSVSDVIRTNRKHKGKKAEDISRLEEVTPTKHIIPEYELNQIFPNGYKELPPIESVHVEYQRARYLKHRDIVCVYAGKDSNGDDVIVKANGDKYLLRNSILTPSLFGSVFEAKYVNAQPINRIAETLAFNDVNISKQVMAGWCIKIAERYLVPVYNEMHRQILKSKLIHCDETPFKVTNDGRDGNSKSYMWVYHTDQQYGSPPIYLYEYQPTRKTENPREFLKDYTGILLTDGYQVYHTLKKENPDKLTVAGCWVHAKRKYAEIIKAVGEKKAVGTIAYEGNQRIATITHVNNMVKGKNNKEILAHRQTSVKPLVDDYFNWVRTTLDTTVLDKASKTYKALNYSLHQEEYLREFLNNPIIPMDNNDAERSIRSFCVGKHNWKLCDTKNGAKSSGILYSIAETAKANNLKPAEYMQYLLEQILLHDEDAPSTYLPFLMPWSEELPERYRNTVKP